MTIMKKGVSFVLTALVLIILIYILRGINIMEIYGIILEANPFYFSLAILSSFAVLIMWNFRWQINIQGIEKIGFWSLIPFLFSGLFFNMITPGRSVGGEPLKAYFLHKKYKKPKTIFLSSIISDKFFHIVSQLILVFASALFILGFFNLPLGSRIFFEVLCIILGFILLIIFALFIFKKEISFMPLISFFYHFLFKRFVKLKKEKINYLKKRFKQFWMIFYENIYRRRIAILSIILSFLFWMFFGLSSYFLFLSFGYKMNFIYVFVIAIMSQFIGDISISPGGFGFTEGSLVLLYSAVGVPLSVSALVAISASLFYYFFGMVIGGICSFYLRFKFN